MSNYAFNPLIDLCEIHPIAGECTTFHIPYRLYSEFKPFTTITMYDGEDPHYQRSCLIAGKLHHAQGKECWVIPPYTHYHFQPLPFTSNSTPAARRFLWCHIEFRLDFGMDLLSLFHVPTVFKAESANRLHQLVWALNRGKQVVYNPEGVIQDAPPEEMPLWEKCRQRRLCWEILEVILQHSQPKPELQLFYQGYQEFLPVLQRIHQNPRNPPTLDELAATIHRSRSCFEKTFRRTFGVAPGKYILTHRLKLAAQLLALHPPGRVAEETGFADVYAFSKAFHKHFGLPPKIHRQNLHSITPL